MTNIIQGDSERKQVAERIASIISENGLTNPFGGNVYKTTRNGRTIYAVDFSIPRILDGCVEIWGKTFIRIRSRGPLEHPPKVFNSVKGATEFIIKAWVE